MRSALTSPAAFPRLACGAFLVCLVLAARPLAAQQYPSQARGLAASTSYQHGGVDHVNLFSGQLHVNVPLGPSYPVGPGLSYALALHYNSNGWDSQEEVCLLNASTRRYGLPTPDPRANAGFGWGLHLGRLFPPRQEPWNDQPRWVYLGPDGAQHGLYEQLHPGHPAAGSQPGTLFTNDGSYLRLKTADGELCREVEGAQPACRLLEHPDGSVHEFHDFSPAGSPEAEGDWRLTRIRDAFGNHLDVEYPGGRTWRLRDSHGRVQRVRFAGPAGAYARVEAVELERFGGGEPATIEFRYRRAAIERQHFARPACAPAEHGLQVEVDLLERIVLPDGSFWEMGYYTSDGIEEVLSGGLRELRLPTGGLHRWRYQWISFVSQDPEELGPDAARAAFGVLRRESFADASDPEPTAVWRYAYKTAGVELPRAPSDGIVPCHHRLTVSDPAGDDTVYYFSSSHARHQWSYGLPFTRCDPARGGVFSEQGPFLSQELYDGPVAEGRKLRSIYVEYESDGKDGGHHQEKNHRVSKTRVVYHDDGDRYREVRLEDFDGLGHYRRATLSGDFGNPDDGSGTGNDDGDGDDADGGDADGGAERTISFDYNPGSGTLESLDPERGLLGGDFRIPARDAPWVLGTFRERRVTEGGRSAVVEHCFDPETGFLLRQRVLAGAERSDADLLSLFEQEVRDGRGTGRVARERYLGGDRQGPMDADYDDLCAMDVADLEAAYELRHSYAYGAHAGSEWLDPATGEVVLRAADRDVDAATGLVAASRDTAGFETAFLYDALGRPLAERPAAGAWSERRYGLPTVDDPAAPAELTLRLCPHGTEDCADEALLWQRTRFDGLGRAVLEQRPLPADGGDRVESRHFRYDGLGRKLAEGVWGRGDVEISYEQHDRFGRPGRVRLPGQAAVRLSYVGDRLVHRGVKVATEEDGTQSWAFTTESFDVFGRLAAVCEDQEEAGDGPCLGLETRYGYDLGGRLSSVCSDAGTSSDGGLTCGQERAFVHDSRGFLVAERHPEIGPEGNGWTAYGYDALGSVVARTIEGGSGFDLLLGYDAAGRLLRLEELDPARGPLVLKEYVYGEENGAGGADLRRGKLVEARRHNRFEAAPGRSAAADAVVVDSYRYEGPGGALSHKATRLALPGGGSFESRFGYDELGEVTSVSYPSCGAPCAGAVPAREVSYRHRWGLLTEVAGFADTIDYQAGGLMHHLRHANGVVETLEVDPETGLPRPHRIATDRGFDTGVYRYDGAGNPRRIGEQGYRYDRLSRLLEGEVATAAGRRAQSAAYDAFGNLTTLETDGLRRLLDVDPATNRLAGAAYDAAGNLTEVTLGGVRQAHRFDAVGALRRLEVGGEPARLFLYDADDERVATLECQLLDGRCLRPGDLQLTLRSPGGQVLRVLERPFAAPAWRWREDTVYRDGQPLAAVEADGAGGERRYHFHLDHLGTPRQVTGAGGAAVARHDYFPFGAAAGSGASIAPAFGGHEREPAGGLDYLHARFASPELGRFLSFDPVGGNPRTPQSWNRYAYVLNNPVKYVDPDGLIARLFLDLAFVVFDQVTVDGGSYLDILDFLALAGRFFDDFAPAGAPELGRVGDLSPPAYSLVQALNGRNEMEMVRFGLDPSAIDTGGVPEFAIFLPLGRLAKVPASPRRYLPTFERSTIEDVVGSSRLMTGGGTRGASLLRKRVADGSFQGRATQTNAERVVRDVLGNPSRVRSAGRSGQVDVIGESFGQEVGLRINVERGNLVGIRRPDF